MPGDMTAATFGPYVLAALPYAGAEALRILAWCIAFTVPAAAGWWLLARARRLARPSTPGIRHLFRAAANADDRHAPIARRLAAADAETQAISMRDITAMERLVPPCPEFCADLTVPGDGTDCKCPAPCGRDWCTRKREQRRNPVPVTWTDRERGIG